MSEEELQAGADALAAALGELAAALDSDEPDMEAAGAAAEKAQADAGKAGKAKFGKHGGKPFFDKPGGGKSGLGKPRREGDDRPAGPRKGRDDADRRR